MGSNQFWATQASVTARWPGEWMYKQVVVVSHLQKDSIIKAAQDQTSRTEYTSISNETKSPLLQQQLMVIITEPQP